MAGEHLAALGDDLTALAPVAAPEADPDDRPARLQDEERELIDEVEAQHILTLVNKDRIELLRRLRKLILFPEQVRGHDRARSTCRVNDPPQIQLLFMLRDELHQMPCEEYKDRQLRMQLLSQITTAMSALTSEASKASVEVQKLMVETMRLRQKQREHDDKMALAREKQGSWSDEELAALAGD